MSRTPKNLIPEKAALPSAPRHIFNYELWGHQVISDFELRELEPSASGGRPHGTLQLCRASENDWPLSADGNAPLEYRLDNGEVWLKSWNAGDSYIARFPGTCSFRVNAEEMRIDYAPEPGAADSTIAHLILDHVIPRLLSLKPGYLALHACAVQVGDRAVAILGKTGQGKSTLAAWFGSQGYPLLTDDCLVLYYDEAARQWLALPSYRSVRLWPDSVDALGIKESALREFAGYSPKKRTGKEVDFRLAPWGAPLTDCFVMPGGADLTSSEPPAPHFGPPEILPIPPNEAFRALLLGAFRLEAEDEHINRREFEALNALTGAVRFWSLAYERNYDWLPAVEKAIIKTMRTGCDKPGAREHAG